MEEGKMEKKKKKKKKDKEEDKEEATAMMGHWPLTVLLTSLLWVTCRTAPAECHFSSQGE